MFGTDGDGDDGGVEVAVERVSLSLSILRHR